MKKCALWLALAALTSSCATGPQAMAGWPDVVVPIEAVKPLKPMTLSYVYKVEEGKPTGTTILRIHVGKDGQTKKVGILEASGHPNLDEAAINTAWRAQYRPYLQNGEPVEVTVVAPIHLKNKR